MNILNPLNPQLIHTIAVPVGDNIAQFFNVKIPSPAEQIQIKSQVARRLNYAPVESVEGETLSFATIIETLNRVITKYPDDFEHFDPSKQNWGDCYDTEYTILVYEKFQEKETAFYEGLKKNKDQRRIARNAVSTGFIHDEGIQNSASGSSQSWRPISATENVSAGSGVSSGFPESSGSFRDHSEIRPSKIERSAHVPPGRDGGSPIDDRVRTASNYPTISTI